MCKWRWHLEFLKWHWVFFLLPFTSFFCSWLSWMSDLFFWTLHRLQLKAQLTLCCTNLQWRKQEQVDHHWQRRQTNMFRKSQIPVISCIIPMQVTILQMRMKIPNNLWTSMSHLKWEEYWNPCHQDWSLPLLQVLFPGKPAAPLSGSQWNLQ